MNEINYYKYKYVFICPHNKPMGITHNINNFIIKKGYRAILQTAVIKGKRIFNGFKLSIPLRKSIIMKLSHKNQGDFENNFVVLEQKKNSFLLFASLLQYYEIILTPFGKLHFKKKKTSKIPNGFDFFPSTLINDLSTYFAEFLIALYNLIEAEKLTSEEAYDFILPLLNNFLNELGFSENLEKFVVGALEKSLFNLMVAIMHFNTQKIYLTTSSSNNDKNVFNFFIKFFFTSIVKCGILKSKEGKPLVDYINSNSPNYDEFYNSIEHVVNPIENYFFFEKELIKRKILWSKVNKLEFFENSLIFLKLFTIPSTKKDFNEIVFILKVNFFFCFFLNNYLNNLEFNFIQSEFSYLNLNEVVTSLNNETFFFLQTNIQDKAKIKIELHDNNVNLAIKLNFSNLFILVLFLFSFSSFLFCFLQIYYHFFFMDLMDISILSNSSFSAIIPCFAAMSSSPSQELVIYRPLVQPTRNTLMTRTSNTSFSSARNSRQSSFTSSFYSPQRSFSSDPSLFLTRSTTFLQSEIKSAYDEGPSATPLLLQAKNSSQSIEELHETIKKTPMKDLRQYKPIIPGPYPEIVHKLLKSYELENHRLINKMIAKEITFEEVIEQMHLASEGHVVLEIFNAYEGIRKKLLTEGSSKDQIIASQRNWRAKSSLYGVSSTLSEISLQQKLEKKGIGDLSVTLPNFPIGVSIKPGEMVQTWNQGYEWFKTKILKDKTLYLKSLEISSLTKEEIYDTKMGLLVENLDSIDFTFFEDGKELQNEWLSFVADYIKYVQNKEALTVEKGILNAQFLQFVNDYLELPVRPKSPKQAKKVGSKNLNSSIRDVSKEVRSMSDPVTAAEHESLKNLTQKPLTISEISEKTMKTAKNLSENLVGMIKNCFIPTKPTPFKSAPDRLTALSHKQIEQSKGIFSDESAALALPKIKTQLTDLPFMGNEGEGSHAISFPIGESTIRQEVQHYEVSVGIPPPPPPPYF